jgi:predicted mannosyl-3-phosphoglycerate phosphatase (HAD superfamily)
LFGYCSGSFNKEPSIDAVLQANSRKPIAKDVIKAAGNHQGVAPMYDQEDRAVTLKSSLVKLKLKESYQLLEPYLNDFLRLNPDR